MKPILLSLILCLQLQNAISQHALFFCFHENKDSVIHGLASIAEVQKIDFGNSFRSVIAYLNNGAAAYEFDSNKSLCKVRLTRNFDNLNGAKSAFNEALIYSTLMQGNAQVFKLSDASLKAKFSVNGNPYVLELIKYGHRDYQVFLEGSLNTVLTAATAQR